MLTPDLVRWQWRFYPKAHRDRRNLLVHILTAPLFVGGLAATIAGIALRNIVAAAAGAACMAIAMAAQGRGHRLELDPPAPFRSPVDAVARILVEQLVTFPRFVVSGAFSRAWRGSAE